MKTLSGMSSRRTSIPETNWLQRRPINSPTIQRVKKQLLPPLATVPPRIRGQHMTTGYLAAGSWRLAVHGWLHGARCTATWISPPCMVVHWTLLHMPLVCTVTVHARLDGWRWGA